LSIGYGSVKSGFVVARPVPKRESSFLSYLAPDMAQLPLPSAGFAGKILPVCWTPSTSC
jgi:hypothetical protein